jgi:hypothetical protein
VARLAEKAANQAEQRAAQQQLAVAACMDRIESKHLADVMLDYPAYLHGCQQEAGLGP